MPYLTDFRAAVAPEEEAAWARDRWKNGLQFPVDDGPYQVMHFCILWFMTLSWLFHGVIIPISLPSTPQFTSASAT
jgi:hypothetical protein